MADENKKNDSSAVGKINSVADKGRNLRRAYGVVKKVRTLAVAAEGVNPATLAVLAIAFIFVATVVILFGGASGVAGGDLTNNPTPSSSTFPSGSPGPTSTTLPACATLTTTPASCLQQDFGITVSGGTQQQLINIYNYLSKYLAYPHAVDLIKKATPLLTISAQYTGINSSWAFTSYTGDVTIYQAFWTGLPSTQKQYLIHEFAHVIGLTNSQLQSQLYSQVYRAGLDSSCFNSLGVIKTFPLTPIDPVVENFAESLADVMVCGTGNCGGWGGNSRLIQNFPVTCISTYSWSTAQVLR